MRIIETDRHREPRRDDLTLLLEALRQEAVDDAHPKLLSINLACQHLDPLAVLTTFHAEGEDHAYFEHPTGDDAIAGADAILTLTAEGPRRFEDAQAFLEAWGAHAVAVGDTAEPRSGPRCFCAATFDPARPDPVFPAVHLFVPRWQVAHLAGRYVAVANLIVGADTDIAAEAERLWRAHERFRRFDYDGAAAPSAWSHPTWEEEGGSQAFVRAVHAIQERLNAGEVEKVVLARCLRAAVENPPHPLGLCARLRETYPTCRTFSWHRAGGHSQVGATPELLLEVDGPTWRTEAIAGTCRRGGTPGEDAALAAALLASDKDSREHEIVARYLADRLAGFGLSPRREARRLLSLPRLHHLITRFSGETQGLSPLKLAAALHPTPAVGGLPTDRACDLIRTHEAFNRGLYTGFIGWIDFAGRGQLSVVLRTARLSPHEVRLYAGGGIVAGSTPAAEWAETELKLESWRRLLG